jgi:hypothetical protein
MNDVIVELKTKVLETFASSFWILAMIRIEKLAESSFTKSCYRYSTSQWNDGHLQKQRIHYCLYAATRHWLDLEQDSTGEKLSQIKTLKAFGFESWSNMNKKQVNKRDSGLKEIK